MKTRNVIRSVWAVALCVIGIVADAQPAMPAWFKTRTVAMSDGAQLFVRSGGRGPAVVLIHGFGDTGDM